YVYDVSKYEHTSTGSSPMFCLTDLEILADVPKSEYAKKAQVAKKQPGEGDDPALSEPDKQMQAPSYLAERAMLAQAKRVNPSGIQPDEKGRKVLRDRMNAGLQMLQMIRDRKSVV